MPDCAGLACLSHPPKNYLQGVKFHLFWADLGVKSYFSCDRQTHILNPPALTREIFLLNFFMNGGGDGKLQTLQNLYHFTL